MLDGKGIPLLNKIKVWMLTSFATFTNCRIALDCIQVQCAIPSNNMV